MKKPTTNERLTANKQESPLHSGDFFFVVIINLKTQL